MGWLRELLALGTGRRQSPIFGDETFPGLDAPIRIHRDRFGIPYIEANSDADAARALGYAQGQDRSGQLELLQRAARGTLSEWAGAKALPVDRITRRIGFHRAAQAQLQVLAPQVRLWLNAFIEGLNHARTRTRPHEFLVLGGDPTPWEP
ncbi:MAG: penicillin acylase family protein, partial [Gemmataceae bacterium]